jgi:hypothetical protein
LDHRACTLDVSDDLLDGTDGLASVRIRTREATESGGRIQADSPEWLAHLMHDPCAHFTKSRAATRVSPLRLGVNGYCVGCCVGSPRFTELASSLRALLGPDAGPISGHNSMLWLWDGAEVRRVDHGYALQI